jgi:hypothetical protein
VRKYSFAVTLKNQRTGKRECDHDDVDAKMKKRENAICFQNGERRTKYSELVNGASIAADRLSGAKLGAR